VCFDEVPAAAADACAKLRTSPPLQVGLPRPSRVAALGAVQKELLLGRADMLQIQLLHQVLQSLTLRRKDVKSGSEEMSDSKETA
jgi:hypothetical protein